MLSYNTVSKLHEMKLSAMAVSFQKQMEDHASSELNFEERFGLLVDTEWISRKNNRLKHLVRKADCKRKQDRRIVESGRVCENIPKD